MKPGPDVPAQVEWEGKFIVVKRKGSWEYVSRTRGVSAAVIVAIDEESHVILVEQYRVALERHCLELPAGLVGDDEEGEDPRDAAIRELEEETGYRAERMIDLGRFHSSPGMASEGFTLLRAERLRRTGEGGGVEGEDILVHRVPLSEVADFVARKRAEGAAVDVKLLLLLAPALLEPGRSAGD